MFTGIIETLGIIEEVSTSGSNKTFWIASPLSNALKPDQSVAHNGVCLTVEAVGPSSHKVTAVAETLQKTALNYWQPGGHINLERSLQVGSRLDGHFVQGHVDTTGICKSIQNKGGSVEFTFQFPPSFAALMIEKGSVCVNGISLTAFNVAYELFTVAIIPYTFEHTNLKYLQVNDAVNLEFDMLGKYLVRRLHLTEALKTNLALNNS